MRTAQERPASADRPADFTWYPVLGCPAHTASSDPSGAAASVAEIAPIGPHRTCRSAQLAPPSAVNHIGATPRAGLEST